MDGTRNNAPSYLPIRGDRPFTSPIYISLYPVTRGRRRERTVLFVEENRYVGIPNLRIKGPYLLSAFFPSFLYDPFFALPAPSRSFLRVTAKKEGSLYRERERNETRGNRLCEERKRPFSSPPDFPPFLPFFLPFGPLLSRERILENSFPGKDERKKTSLRKKNFLVSIRYEKKKKKKKGERDAYSSRGI